MAKASIVIAKASIVIMHEWSGTFWTGAGFSPEYPDAALFTSKREAKKELKAISQNEAIAIVEDYGLESQRVLLEGYGG